MKSTTCWNITMPKGHGKNWNVWSEKLFDSKVRQEMKATCLSIILLLAAFLFGGRMVAQTYLGVVKTEKGDALSSVSVMLKNEKGSVVAFATTNAKGAFSLNNSEGKAAMALEFRHIGFATVTLPIGKYQNGRTVMMKEEAFTLKEVKVKPQKIRQSGDTLNYLVGSFRHKQDRSIADVIARMPGLEVKKDGSIQYQGKSINKFYIEGMDLMGGKYAVASENIDVGKVKKVQVLENHQPVKMLKGMTFSDQAALNIVLEDAVKDTWQGEATLSGGASLQDETGALYDCRLLAMLFSRTKQSISMYKCNNTGKDISNEVKSLGSFENYVPTEGGLLSVGISDGTGLDEKRTLFNNTHVWATNWLFRTPQGNDLRLQMTALFDKSRQRQESQTVYTDVAGNAIVTESSYAMSYRNEYDGEVMYKVNKDNVYLVNTLKGYADFNRSVGQTVLGGEETDRNVRLRKRYVTDNLKFIKNLKNKHCLMLNMSFSYSYLPGTLLLSEGTTEKLDISTLYWQVNTEFRHKLGRMYVDYTAGAELKRQDIDVENYLNTVRDSYDEYRLYLSPYITYKRDGIDLSVRVPLNWRYRKLNDHDKTILLVEPGAFLRLEPTARWQFLLNYAYLWNPLDALTSGSATVFTDYITAHRGSGHLENIMSHTGGLTVRYKDVISSFFANGGVTCSNTRGAMMYKGELRDNVYYSTPVDRHTNSTSVSFRASVSKGFYWADLLVRLSANHGWRNYYMLVSDEQLPFRTETTTLKADISVKPTRWLSASLASSFNRSRQIGRKDDSGSTSPLKFFEHRLRMYVMPGNWLVVWDNELYHSNDKTVSAIFFSDFSVSYKTKKMEAGLSINNIFGKQEFERRYITDTQKLYTMSRLRPCGIMAKVRFGF